ncbi:TIM23 complex component [Saitoella coloradoensis]
MLRTTTLRSAARTALPTPLGASIIRRSVGTTPSGSEAPASSTTPAQKLDWPTFLSLRQQCRHVGLAFAPITGLASMFASFVVLGSQDIDPSQTIYGFDPFIAYGAATVCIGGVGALLGPAIGEGLWWMTKGRPVKAQMQARQKEFYDKIKKHRVDASRQSFANPVPDYYGEKIANLKGYRQWLRDQKAFRNKSQRFL